MARASFVALAFVPLVIGAGAPSASRFKEAVCVDISAPAGAASARLALTVKGEGLRVYKSNCSMPLSGPAVEKADTITAPTKLLLFSLGAGEADLVALDSMAKYTVSIAALNGPTEAKKVTASHVVIGHGAAVQPKFSIRAVDSSNR